MPDRPARTGSRPDDRLPPAAAGTRARRARLSARARHAGLTVRLAPGSPQLVTLVHRSAGPVLSAVPLDRAERFVDDACCTIAWKTNDEPVPLLRPL
jgi:hypothetical protein